MNQNFSSDQLLKLCKESEIMKIGKSKEDLAKSIDEEFTKISNGTFEFNIIATSEFFKTDNLIDTLVLRKLNDNLNDYTKMNNQTEE